MEEQKYICKICDRVCKSASSLGSHLVNNHKCLTKDYYDKYKKVDGEGICKICKHQTKFVKMSIGYRTYCSPKCVQLDKDVRNKIESTCLEKYGVRVSSMNSEVKQKMENTMIERYGVDCIFKQKEYKENLEKNKHKKDDEYYAKRYEKYKNTIMEKYGVDNYFKTDSLKKNSRTATINRATERVTKLLESQNKSLVSYNDDKTITIKCHCGEYSTISKEFYFGRKKGDYDLCLSCNPFCQGLISKPHQEIYDFIKSFSNVDLINNDRTAIDPLEIDIYCPSKKIGIEFNGLYWHSNKPIIHYFKSDLCNKVGIELVHIFEDEWKYKRTIVEDKLKKIFGVYESIIDVEYSKVTDNNVINEFLKDNHIFGVCEYTDCFGAYKNGKLVSLCVFNKVGETIYLKRFCDILGFKTDINDLFNYSINILKSDIHFFCDRLWPEHYSFCVDNSFINMKKNKPSFWFVHNDIRIKNKFSDKKIYDSGSYIFKKEFKS